METLFIIGIIVLLCLPGLALAVGGLALLVKAFEKMFGKRY
jgi:hypothetical protein